MKFLFTPSLHTYPLEGSHYVQATQEWGVMLPLFEERFLPFSFLHCYIAGDFHIPFTLCKCKTLGKIPQ